MKALAIAICALAAGAGLPGQAKAPRCAPAATAAVDVAAAMSEMYVALASEDAARFGAIVAPTFYAFDGGKRYSGAELVALIKGARAKGLHYVWSVTKPDVKAACTAAWIAYVNEGSIEDASGAKPLTWLESAFLEFSGGRWRVLFLHSTRVPQP